jgi:uncharacterized RDD family membrane protein YckC
MFCVRCGHQIQAGDRFCQSCGQEIGAFGAASSPPALEASSGSTVGAGFTAPLPYAGFWLRLSAYSIDGVILGIPFMILLIVVMFFFGEFGLMRRRNPLDERVATVSVGSWHGVFVHGGSIALFLVFLLGMIFFVGLQWLYFAGMESSERQATFGKVLTSLKVTDLQGRRITFKRATGRFFAKFITGMIPLAIGYIMAGFTAKKQALHDIIARTLVLRKL